MRPFFEKEIEFSAEGLGLLDANAYLSYFSKNAYVLHKELLKLYFFTKFNGCCHVTFLFLFVYFVS